MNLISIPALQDNYIWILVNKNRNCLIVDPGEASSVLVAIKENFWKPDLILLTHHHDDHLNGVKRLITHFPNIKVYGPKETQDHGTTHVIHGNKRIVMKDWNISVISTPGHTSSHLSYYCQHYLFCGDTIFSGGCGRLLGGTLAQMYSSFQRINSLPEETLICCSHEYTLENMRFALSIMPNNPEIKSFYYKIKKLREKNQKTLPGILKNERKINVFLMTKDIHLIKKINEETSLQYPEERFAWLRSKKDNFRCY